jgi:hypothetical protein
METPKLSRPQTRNPDATPEEIRAWHAEWAEYEIQTGKSRDDVLREKHTAPVHAKRDALPEYGSWGRNPPASLEAPYFRCPLCPEYREIHAGGIVRAERHLRDSHPNEDWVGDVEFFSLPDSAVDPDVGRAPFAPVFGSWDPVQTEEAE